MAPARPRCSPPPIPLVRRVVTLLTDFGTADGYVAEVKGVLLTDAPDANVVDLSHEIPPQDVECARLAVARYWRRFPAGTVHLVVVDPGVGSERAAIAVSSDGRLLVGPDNGVLSPAMLFPGAVAVRLPVSPDASATFHGRDVFAPAGALLALGVPLERLGPPHPHPVIRRTPAPTVLPSGSIAGEIIAVDRFGNAVTNFVAPRGGTVAVGELRLEVRRVYADVSTGEPVALTGSTGLVEIAVRDGRADVTLRLRRGSPVVFHPRTR